MKFLPRPTILILLGLLPLTWLTALPLRAENGKAMVEALARSLPDGDLGAVWRDRTFTERFVGSYGFLSGAEPAISAAESEYLSSLLTLIQSDPGQAIRRLQGEIRPENSAAFDFILGNLLFQSGRTSEAEQAYRNALRKFPDFRRAHKNLGLLRIQMEQYDAAAESIARALEMGDVDARSFGLLGYAHFQTGRFFAAEIAYRQAMLLQPTVVDWQTGLVRTLIETQRPAEAVALLDHMTRREPERIELWLLQANAHLTASQPARAAHVLEIVERLSGPTPRTSLLLGDIYVREGIPELALASYLRVLETESAVDSFQPLLRAAGIFLQQGNTDAARQLGDRLQSALGETLDHGSNLRLLTFRSRLARSDGDTELAHSLLEQIVSRDSLNGEAYIELGRLFADSGETARAIVRFEQAARIPGFEREALIGHAQALVRENRLPEAIPLLRRALQIKPDAPLEDYLLRVERAARGR